MPSFVRAAHFGNNTFLSTCDVTIDLTGCDGLMVQVANLGGNGSGVSSVTVDPGGANIALTALTQVNASAWLGLSGQIREFIYTGSLPQASVVVRCAMTDANGKPDVDVIALSGCQPSAGISLVSRTTGGSTAMSTTQTAAAGSLMLNMLRIGSPYPDGNTLTATGAAALAKRILSTSAGGTVKSPGAVLTATGTGSGVATGVATQTTLGQAMMAVFQALGVVFSIGTNPTNQTSAAGASATFSVSTSGGSAPVTYQWQRSIDGGTTWANVTSGTGGTTASYTTPASAYIGGAANNGDKYRCLATDASTTTLTSAVATLTVTSAPVFSVHPSNQSAGVGSTAVFSAASVGTPTITYQWQRSVNSGASWADISGANLDTYVTPAATLTGGAANNGDLFRRVDTNGQGSTSSNAGSLSVTTSVVFSGPIASQSGYTGLAFSLSLAGNFSGGTPPYTYSILSGALPTGLSLNASTGVISGTPSAATAQALVVRATDSAGSPTTANTNSFTITIAAPGSITIPGLKSWTGTVQGGLTIPNLVVIDRATRATVLSLTNQTADDSGNLSITNSSLVAGTGYMVLGFTADGTSSFRLGVTAA